MLVWHRCHCATQPQGKGPAELHIKVQVYITNLRKIWRKSPNFKKLLTETVFPPDHSQGELLSGEYASSIPVHWCSPGAVLQHWWEKPGFIRQMTKKKPTSSCRLTRCPPAETPTAPTPHTDPKHGVVIEETDVCHCSTAPASRYRCTAHLSPVAGSSSALMQKHLSWGKGCC